MRLGAAGLGVLPSLPLQRRARCPRPRCTLAHLRVPAVLPSPPPAPPSPRPPLQIGPVADVQLIKDKISGRSKGLGYVEFEDLDSVPKALLLNGQAFCMKHAACSCSGFPIAVKPSEVEKNYAALAEAAGGSASAQTLERRVYIGDLALSVSEGDLKALGGVVGAVDKAVIIRDARGRPRGAAYIQYVDAPTAARALSSLHGLDLAGGRIRVGRLNALGDVVCADGSTFPLDDGKGTALTAHARAALMSQLSTATSQAAQALGSTLLAAAAATQQAAVSAAQGGGAVDPAVAAAAAAAVGGGGVAAARPSPLGVPSPCLVLLNLFDPATETEEVRACVRAEIYSSSGPVAPSFPLSCVCRAGRQT